MIVAGFHTRNDDWILPHKLEVLSTFCDAIVVTIDRSPQSEEICKRFTKVIVKHWENSGTVPDMGPRGALCEEGKMRQATWDACAALNPEYIVLGDTDEIPSPSIVQWLKSRPRDSELWYAHWVNLIKDSFHAIGGEDSSWSWQREGTNKKGMVVRYVKGKGYRYNIAMTRHCRLEPNTLNPCRAIFDSSHKLGSVPLVHYKWANWRRWEKSPEYNVKEFEGFPYGASIVQIPQSYIWKWRACDMVEQMPEPIAVVGNGPMHAMGFEIDEHKTVLRFNNWITDGHEYNVGSRTTHWVTNCWETVEPRPWTGPMFTPFSLQEQPQRIAEWMGMYPHMRIASKSWCDEARVIKRNNPSTGLITLYQLAKMGKRVDAYGFDGMMTGHYFNADHRHDHAKEPDALRQLANRINFRS